MNVNHDDIPIFHEDYIGLWKEINQKTNEETVNSKYQELSRHLGKFAELNRQFISVFSIKSQRVLYMSDNYLNIMGYDCTEDEYKKWSTVYWMRDLPLSQSWFFMQMTLFFKTTVQSKLKAAGKTKSLDWYMHNFLLSPPRSHMHHISLSGSALELADDGSMPIMMLIIKDVGGLVKENSPWWTEFHINKTEKFIFHQNNKNFNKGSVLSDREKEILLLIKEGFETKEIAEKLFLSTHTVDKHRKNMMEYVGAKDSSSLLQICTSGNII